MLVSVCITTYNHAAFIEQCVLSVLNQKTNFEFEICLGEDDSSDGTREICQELASQHPDKIRLFLRDRKDVYYINGRATGRYNFFHTLKACKGKYIAIIDGDDYWCDEFKLQKSIDILENNSEIVLVHHDVEIVDEYGNLSGKTMMPSNFPQIAGIEQMIETNRATASSVVMKNMNSAKLDGWFWQTSMGDWPLNLTALQGGGKMYAIKEVMSCYRQHSGGVWSSQTDDQIKYNMAKSYRVMLEQGLYREVQSQAIEYYAQLLINMLSTSTAKCNGTFTRLVFKDLEVIDNYLGVTHQKMSFKMSLRKKIKQYFNKSDKLQDWSWYTNPIKLV